MSTRSPALIEAQRRYAKKNHERIMEYKRNWVESKGKAELSLKYYPRHKRLANYYPIKVERQAYAWLRQLFK